MNSEVEFRFIPSETILDILPLLKELNPKVSDVILSKRILEMSTQNYKCLGAFNKENLIGICGLWFCTRHYSGRSMEPDHVIIRKDFQGQGIGEKMFEWLFEYGKANGIEAVELNTYVQNTRSHKFYYNLGYEILGYHFLKVLK